MSARPIEMNTDATLPALHLVHTREAAARRADRLGEGRALKLDGGRIVPGTLLTCRLGLQEQLASTPPPTRFTLRPRLEAFTVGRCAFSEKRPP